MPTGPRRRRVALAAAAVAIAGLLLVLASRSRTSSDGTEAADGARDSESGSRTPASPKPGAGAAARSPALAGGGAATQEPEVAVAVDDPAAQTGAVEGRVVSFSSGEPVAGADLTFARIEAASVRSGTDGVFVFQPPSAGTWRLAAATAQGFLPFAPEWGHSPIAVTAVPGRRVRGVTVWLVPAIDYRGLVLDPEGKPAAGAEVRALGSIAGEHVLVPLADRWVADTQGEFTFHAPDDTLLEARKEGFSPARASLDFGAQVSHRLTLRLKPGRGPARTAVLSIRGRVTDERGPVEGARVLGEFEAENPASQEVGLATSSEAASDPEGRFSLGGLDPGPYTITALKEGYAPARLEKVAAGATDLEMRLTSGGRLSGAVTDAASGAPVGSFVVSVFRRPDSLKVERVAGAAFVEPSGRYQLDALPKERLRATVSASRYAEPQELDVDLTSGAATADFALSRGARLPGRVLDRASKQPLVRARVTVEGRRAMGAAGSAVPTRATTLTGDGGRFLLEGLAAGTLSITVAAQDHHGRIVTGLAIPETGDAAPVEVELTPVKDGEEPKMELAGIGVTLAPKGDFLAVGTVFPGGGAEAAGLKPGDELLAVDGRAVKGLGYEGSINAIRGPEGSTVVLTLRRVGVVTQIAVQRKLIRA